MKDQRKKEKADAVEQAALTGVGAGVGGAGGATFGVLELAAQQGSVTPLSAGVVIGAGAVAGGLAFFYAYRAWRRLKQRKS